MDIIVSRRFELPQTPEDLEADFYFSLWQKRNWPFDSLKDGVTVFLYESPTQTFVWKARAKNVRTKKYDSLSDAYKWLQGHYGEFDHDQAYLDEPAKHGYCVAFECTPIELLNLPKPKGLRLPMLGWVNDPEFINECGLK